MTRGRDIVAVVPVKGTIEAKSRLGPEYPPEFRCGLAQAMLEDVLAALCAAKELAGVVVVTVDPVTRETAARFGIKDRELVKVVTRRGAAEFPAQLVETIREDTVFIPYHWPGRKSANQLTSGHLDPISKIPEFKVCACRLEPQGRPAPSAAETKAYASA